MLFVWPSNPQNQTWNRSWETLKLFIIDPDSTWWWLLCQAQGFHPPTFLQWQPIINCILGRRPVNAVYSQQNWNIGACCSPLVMDHNLWLALSVTLCAMMQQNRTCTIDQITPTKCLIFTLLATSKCHNSHSWSKLWYQCNTSTNPHYNLPESAVDHFSLWQGCVLVVLAWFSPGTITNNSENSFQQYRRQPE